MTKEERWLERGLLLNDPFCYQEVYRPRYFYIVFLSFQQGDLQAIGLHNGSLIGKPLLVIYLGIMKQGFTGRNRF